MKTIVFQFIVEFFCNDINETCKAAFLKVTGRLAFTCILV